MHTFTTAWLSTRTSTKVIPTSRLPTGIVTETGWRSWVGVEAGAWAGDAELNVPRFLVEGPFTPSAASVALVIHRFHHKFSKIGEGHLVPTLTHVLSPNYNSLVLNSNQAPLQRQQPDKLTNFFRQIDSIQHPIYLRPWNLNKIK